MDAAELQVKLKQLRQAMADGDPERLFISVPKKTVNAMLDRIAELERQVKEASDNQSIA
jgi:hypothetical protein